MDDTMSQNVCKCPHHKIVPILVILFALAFLGGNLGWWSMHTVNLAWPILVGLAGIMKLCEGSCKCC